MQTDWLTFTQSAIDFSALASQNTVSLLNDSSLLVCSGPDSAKFLQGQLTCNLQDTTPTQTRPGAHCTPKGRMVANFRLAQIDTLDYGMRTHTDTASALQKSLARYIVFSKAKLRDASDNFLLLGINGPNAQTIMEQIFGQAPLQRHEIFRCNAGFILRVNDSAQFECWIHAAQAKAIWLQLCDQATATGAHYWHWLNIRDGFGEVRAETIEAFTPQMLNLQLIDGISFTKGCYTGQEIVARSQYRGALKKAMYRFSGNGAAPTPNSPIYLPEQNQATGHVVMAEAISSNAWEGLIVVPHDTIHQKLQLDNGALIHLLPLPYTLPPAHNVTDG